MKRETKPFLLVERGGDAGEQGRKFYLDKERVVLGRRDEASTFLPDIEFDNPWVSRKHAEIRCKDELCVLTDTDSKHGTEIKRASQPNWKHLEPHVQHPLEHNDSIRLAKGQILLRYCKSASTLDKLPIEPLLVDVETRKVFVAGKEVQLSPKEYDLLVVLSDTKAHHLDEIAQKVWPEDMVLGNGESPGEERGTSDETIQRCVTRLRRKLEHAPEDPEHATGIHITPVRGFGYRLDVDA